MCFLTLIKNKNMNSHLQISENKEIRQSNILTEARIELSACQLNILFYLISILKPGILKYTINARELMELSETEWNYQQLRESTGEMVSKLYEYKKPNGNLLQITVFASCEYISGQGIIEIELSEKIIPFLFDLREQFTSFRLLASLNMSSKYAKRLYMMLSQWKDLGEWKTTIQELKTRLKLVDPTGKEPEQYKQIVQFKERVLEPAVAQINQHTELKVSYKMSKKGRSFKNIEFHIDIQKPKQMPSIDFEQDLQEQRCAKNMEEIGIKRQDLIEKVVKDETLRKQVFKWYHDWKIGKLGKVNNPAGLLLKTLGLV